MKIYLDDVRTPVEKDWQVVRSFYELSDLVQKVGLNNIDVISLDHDLGDSAMTEYHTNVSPNYKLSYENINENFTPFTNFENDNKNVYYPVNKVVASNIIATTGEYYGKTGKVSLFPKPDGSRIVNVTFDS